MSDRDAFGHWLSGFCDGEACFYIGTCKPRTATGFRDAVCIRFVIKLRGDDRSILESIRDYLECGAVSHAGKAKPNHGRCLQYLVASVDDLRNRVVPHFVSFPLRAKKRRDFEVFSQCVEFAWGVSQRPSIPTRDAKRGHPFAPKWDSADLDTVSDFARRIREGRAYS